MVHMLAGLLLHMVQQLVQRVVKDMVLMMMKMMKDRESTMSMSMMRLTCPSLKMHPKELKAPPVPDVHRGRSDQWTGTLQVPIRLGGESVTLAVHVKVLGSNFSIHQLAQYLNEHLLICLLSYISFFVPNLAQ